MQHSPPLVLAPDNRAQAAARIHQSWSRCADLDPRLLVDPDPLPRADLSLKIETHQPLLQYAEPSLSALGALVGSTNGIAVLADPSGLILHERGNPGFLDKAQRIALQAGVSWAESRRGTNAIGTALHDGHAVRVHGAEHFLARNSILSCHAAPIFSATGEILGILDLSGPADALCHYALPLVQSLAQGISNQILFSSPLRRLDFHLGEQAGPDSALAILLLDDDARIAGANEAALRALGADWQLIGTPCNQWIDGAWQTRNARLHRHDGQPLNARLHAPARPLVSLNADSHRPAHPPLPDTLPQPDALHAPLLQQGVRAIDSGLAVLLQGETGTGKEVLARHIHTHSGRRQGAFIAINCAALPEHLIESELFGYEGGAFTGARREGARGLLRQAHQGILFLDEIGDMPLGLQTRLLRVLQEREVQPLGSEKRIPLDFGLVSASHQDLKALVDQGRFRADLYYRLQDMPLTLPPLRQRPDLAWFIDTQYQALGGQLAPDAAALLAAHAWPGNYRELRSVLRRLRCQYPTQEPVLPAHLPADLTANEALEPCSAATATAVALATLTPTSSSGSRRLQDVQQATIRQVLQECAGNMAQAARRLGIHRSTLYRRLK
ncbi:sigma-54-dependent Fis family transcriptional regulator [Castellaniella sp.]|uniref:sigma-54-dependent Fis family transcriptional regulator n=1 Tax=Castellaniella sp. TaxID=1955812 RepID=UPI002AFFAF56|nr:sigma-54-dependent Fis family transcriptional regulator [Castellaniella sp.]